MIRHGSQRGFALLIVLWTLVLITLLVSRLTASGRSETQLAGNLRSAAQLQAQADGEVYEAIFHLMQPGTVGWQADGSTRTIKLDHAVAEVRIFDEGGLVNPSTATPELLQSLMRALGTPSGTAARLAEAIVAWRTPSGNQDASSARFDAYRAAGRAIGPSGTPFLSIEELGAVIGMTPDLLARLAPHFSLYTESDPIPALADPVVRQAMGGAVGGSFASTDANQPQIRIVDIDVTVAGPAGTQFVRHAVVRLTDNASTPDYRVLAWDGPGER